LAERAIQTYKSNFIAILAGIDTSFPMSLWDHLVPQAVMTLNLLHQANKIPSVSAYQFVNASEVVLCPILYCIDVFSTYPGKILDFVVVHWSFIFVSHDSRLIVEFI
jgi:hypothetical protein